MLETIVGVVSAIVWFFIIYNWVVRKELTAHGQSILTGYAVLSSFIIGITAAILTWLLT